MGSLADCVLADAILIPIESATALSDIYIYIMDTNIDHFTLLACAHGYNLWDNLADTLDLFMTWSNVTGQPGNLNINIIPLIHVFIRLSISISCTALISSNQHGQIIKGQLGILATLLWEV